MTQEEETANPGNIGDSFDRLKCVYDDVAGRLVNDDKNSWGVIVVSTGLLGLLATFLRTNGGFSVVLLATVIASFMFLFAILFSFVSRLAFRDIRNNRLAHCLLDNETIVKMQELGSLPSVFHTSVITNKYGTSRNDSLKYLSDIQTYTDEDLASYILFLAHLIELRRKLRTKALLYFFRGGIALAALLIVRLF